MAGEVVSVSRNPRHKLFKAVEIQIRLVAGIGVEGDAHAGPTVQHRSRKRWQPELPNLRQVHLFAVEMLEELRVRGFDVAPGRLGENVTTCGIDLLGLPAETRLTLGSRAMVELTGLRNPCVQLDRLQAGLVAATLDRDAVGGLQRRAGVMAVVLESGEVRAGDRIAIELPGEPHTPLAPV